jgi:hypothetical protein
VRAAGHGRPETTDSDTLVLQRIIEMNRSRILSRLRSKHGKTKGKPEIVPRLAVVVRGPSASNALGHISADELTALQKYMEGLEDIYRRIEDSKLGVSSEDLKLLADLVKCAHDISGQRSLKVLLECFPEMQQTEKECLYKAVGKLGRYYSASRFLIRAARKLPIFRGVRIETLSPSTQRCPTDDPKISINVLLESLFPTLPSSQKRNMNASAHARLRKKCANADAAISESLSHKYRVHAEIQLLVHYALKEDVEVQPRVICASKNACFLCNLFLRFDGRFYTRKTHGRLYEKWMMPNNGPVSRTLAQRVSGVLAQIQDVLVEEIRKTLQVGKLITNYPNESVLAPSARWSSPSHSVVRSQKDAFTGSIAGDAAGDSSVDTPGVYLTPESDQIDRLSKASSRTSTETLTAALPERTTVDPTGSSPPLKLLPETIFRQLPSGSPSYSGPETIIQATRGDSPGLHGTMPVPDSPPLVVGAGESAHPRIPITTNDLTLPMQPVDAVSGNGSHNIQPTPDISPHAAASEGDGAVTPPPVDVPIRAPTPPLVPQIAPNAVPAREPTPTLPTPPLAAAQSPASTPSQERFLLLQRGIAVRRELHQSDPELRIHTPRIHATVTSDVLSSPHLETGRRCRVLVRYLLPNERPWMSRQGRNIVTVRGMERGEERTVDYGAANERTSLYLRNGGDLVEVKYDPDDTEI